VVSVVIIERGDGRVQSFKCLLSDYKEGVLVSEGGFEGQRFIPLKQMEVITGR